jgi:probable rRNA maturation factor
MNLMLDVQYACTEPAPEPDTLQPWIEQALRMAGHDRAGEIALRVIDSGEMSALNLRFRGREGPTNVLSFPVELPAGVELPLLGDIAICAPLVRSEALEQGKPERAHWAHLCVHGTLHLLGHDHQHAAEAERMEALERDILQALGFPCPYTGYPHAAGYHPATQSNASPTNAAPTTEEQCAS